MPDTKIFSYEWPGRVIIGPGAAQKLGEQVLSLGVSHPFILIDPGVAGLLDPLLQSLNRSGLTATMYHDVIGNPDVPSTDAAARAFVTSSADCVVGFGGGSALDMAKGVRMLAGDGLVASSAEYISTRGPLTRPAPPVHNMAPMIAIPTTAGTGSEVTPWGIITDPLTRQKAGIGGVNLTPSVALIDPHLTASLPPFLAAATGMDALSHLIEAYVSTHRNPLLDPLILRGIELVRKNLPTAVFHPDNQAARLHMLEAAMLGGLAIGSNYLGACHSLAHQLSTFAGMHHGLACALMLPPQMAFSLAGASKRYGDIARALSRKGRAATPEEAPRLVAQLNQEVNLTVRLRDAGVTADIIPTMAEFAMKDLNWTTNPRPPTVEDMRRMYEQVF